MTNLTGEYKSQQRGDCQLCVTEENDILQVGVGWWLQEKPAENTKYIHAHSNNCLYYSLCVRIRLVLFSFHSTDNLIQHHNMRVIFLGISLFGATCSSHTHPQFQIKIDTIHENKSIHIWNPVIRFFLFFI